MKKYYVCLIAALVMMSFFGVQSSHAAWSGPAVTQTVLIEAVDAELDNVAANSNYIFVLAPGQGLTQNDTVTIDITGGAKFSGNPGITLQGNGGADFGNGANIASPPYTSTTTSATWRLVNASAAAGTTLTFNTASTIFDLRDVPDDADVDVQITMKMSNGNVIVNKSGVASAGNPPVYPFTAEEVDEISALTAEDDTADVAATEGPYTAFVGGGLDGTATTYTYKNDSGATTIPANAAISANKVLITLSGDFTGIEEVTGAGITGCDAGGANPDAANYTNKFKIVGDKAYAVNTNAVAAGATLATAPRWHLDGETSQEARSFTVEAEVLADTLFVAHDVQDSEGTLYTIDRNGATRKLYNIPPPGGSDKGFVRITNKTASAGKIVGTMYNQDGQLLGTANTVLVETLQPNQTVVFTETQLAALFANWTTGRARIVINAELTGMEIMGLVRSANGTLTNMSSVALEVN